MIKKSVTTTKRSAIYTLEELGVDLTELGYNAEDARAYRQHVGAFLTDNDTKLYVYVEDRG